MAPKLAFPSTDTRPDLGVSHDRCPGGRPGMERLRAGMPLDTDGRRAAYTQLADDASVAAKKREAAMLFSAAEKRLEKEDIVECIRAAEGAEKLFQALGDSGAAGLADSYRLHILAYMMQADATHSEATEARKLANMQLDKFQKAGDKRGTALMLLSLAEVNCDSSRGSKDGCTEGLDQARDAAAIFKDLQDEKMQAISLLTQGFLLLRMYEVDEALDAFTAAHEVAEGLGDNKTVAKTLRGIALHTMLTGKYSTAIEQAREASAFFNKAGDAKWEAALSMTIARWHLLDSQPKKALSVIEKALEILRELENGKGWEGMAILVLAEVQISLRHSKAAFKPTREALARFRATGDQKSEVFALEALARLHIACEAPERALTVSDEAKDLLRARGDRVGEASLLHTCAAIHLHLFNNDKALECLREAADVAEDAGDKSGAAQAQRAISSLEANKSPANSEAALVAATAAYDLSVAMGDKYGEATDTLAMSVAESMMEEAEKAEESALSAQEIFQDLHDTRGEAKALELLAELKLMADKTEAALEAAEERLTIVRDLGDQSLEASSEHQLARLHLADIAFAEAEKHCKEALTLYQDMGDVKGEVETMITLLQVYVAEAGTDKESESFAPSIEQALTVATDAVSAATKLGNKNLRATALYFKAMALMYSESFQDAAQVASQAEKIFNNTCNEMGEARCMILAASLQVISGNMDVALTQLDKALIMARQCGDPFGENEANHLMEAVVAKQQAAMAEQQQMFVPQQMMQQQFLASQGMVPEEVAAPMSAAVAAPVGLDPMFVRKQLMWFVKEVVAGDDEIELDTPFMEAGMDSLSSVSLMSMVAKEFQMALSPSLVFDFPTVRSLEDHLVEESKDV